MNDIHVITCLDFLVQRVDGQCFLKLTEDILKSFIPQLGFRMKLCELQEEVLCSYF